MSEPTLQLQGYCPVAYHAVGKPMKGSPEFSATFGGKRYHLVNEDARREFESNPEKYIPAYGGACAFGMSIGKEFEADPTNFKIVDGRLHLFLKNAETNALHLWNAEPEAASREQADEHFAACQSTC